MIQRGEFERRRGQLMRMTGPESIVIVSSAPIRYRAGDCAYPYRQDSDFYYLTGFPEPDAVLVLMPGRSHGEALLFCHDEDPDRTLWYGHCIGLEAAKQEFRMDDAFPISDLDDILPGLLEGRERVYSSIGREPGFDQRLMEWIRRLRLQAARTGCHVPEEFISLEHLLHDLRLFKSRAEVASMRAAARISATAHQKAMARVAPGIGEHDVQAELRYAFHRANATEAYIPTVGGGQNGCILHYFQNDQQLMAGDLLLIDAGAEVDHYACDITRTIPISGRFTIRQRQLYEVVLRAQEAAIGAIRPGNSWHDPHVAAVHSIAQGLIDLGVLEGDLDDVLGRQAHTPFFMHKTGHWIGMDVHDVGDYRVDGEWRVLEPGMVMTVEPGLYFAPDDHRVDEQWRGMAVRVEDVVAVTRDGSKVLSYDTPKTVAEIERAMRR